MLRLAQVLPDIPRWVEVRSALLAGTATIVWVNDDCTASVCRISDELIVLTGAPPALWIEHAVALSHSRAQVLGTPESAFAVSAALPDWIGERATLHTLPDDATLPAMSGTSVRLLHPEDLAGLLNVPADLARELADAVSEDALIAADFAGEDPVAFCYAGAVTETLWDISIDTLQSHRRRGHAARCVTYLIEHFRRERRRPVWGAVASNVASWRLAGKLGFVPVDEVIIWSRARRTGA